MKLKKRTEYETDLFNLEKKTKISESYYNEDGRQTKKLEFYPSGKIFLEERFEYFEDGSLKSETSWNEYNAKTTRVYEYEGDRLKSKISTYPDGSTEMERRSFTENKERIELVDTKGKLTEVHKIFYDEQENIISYEYCDGAEHCNERQEYLYDENQCLIQQLIKDVYGNILATINYEHDENGFLIKEEYIDTEYDARIYCYEYRYENELIQEERIEDYSEGDIQQVISYTYSDDNNTDKMVRRDFEGRLLGESAFTYNEYGVLTSFLSTSVYYSIDKDATLVEMGGNELLGMLPNKNLVVYENEYY